MPKEKSWAVRDLSKSAETAARQVHSISTTHPAILSARGKRGNNPLTIPNLTLPPKDASVFAALVRRI
jgi:hypothetical protein